MSARGKVWLVGAGPGAADLLTLRAARALESADLVLFDALVDATVLDLAPRATRFYVGKRAGRHSMRQRTIERLMVRAARRGQRVVRLKCGDPFVFGRGGEEALALRDAGIDVEIVCGVTAATSGALAAGIPVTHRGVASGFVVLTGQPDTAWRATLAALPPGSLTIVMMMALGCRQEIASQLEARGWRRDTPVAIVRGAHTPQQHVTRTTIGVLARTDEDQERGAAPGVLIIGDVVHIGDALAFSAVSSSSPEVSREPSIA